MKIAHIIAGDLWAGAEAQVFTLIKELSQTADIFLHIILFNHGQLEQQLKTLDCEVIVFPEKSLTSATLLLKTFQYIKQVRPDLIHTHKQKENVIGAIAGYFARIPSIRTMHGASENKIKAHQAHKFFYRAINYFITRYLQTGIIAVSHQLSDVLRLKFPNTKIWVIPNGIEPVTDLTKQPALNITRNENSGIINIAIICRLVEVKRVDIFINIAHKTLKEFPDSFNFTIYGDGPQHDKLRTLRDSLGLQEKVKFKGFVSDIASRMKDIDLVLITSDHEGLPMTLLEATQHKVPVISNDVGEVSSVLCEGKCGTILQSQNISIYANKLEEFMHNRKPFLDMADKAYHFVQENYSSNRMMKNYLIVYQSIIARDTVK